MRTKEVNCIACGRGFYAIIGELEVCGICTEKHPEVPAELIKNGKKYDTLKETHQELIETLDRFMKYYESDFFCLTSKDGRTQAEWTTKANKILTKAKNL